MILLITLEAVFLLSIIISIVGVYKPNSFLRLLEFVTSILLLIMIFVVVTWYENLNLLPWLDQHNNYYLVFILTGLASCFVSLWKMFRKKTKDKNTE